MATELQTLKGKLLKNVILSSNPCPSCKEAAEQPPMTKTAWRESKWGLPDSKKRYCNLKGFNCHCILVPVDWMKDLPDIGGKVPLRGDPDTDIRAIIEIGPNERELANLMDEYNATIGKLPEEIYEMPLEDVSPYLRKLLKSGPGTPPAPMTPLGYETAEEAIDTIWKKTERTNREACATFNKEGKFLFQKEGSHSSIAYTADECESLFGGSLHHTHPSDTAFSFEDFHFAQRWNLKEMTAVGKRHIYYLRPTDTWADCGEIQYASFRYNQLRDKYHKKYEKLFDKLVESGISEEIAGLKANHYLFLDLWRDMSEEFPIEFIAKRKGGK